MADIVWIFNHCADEEDKAYIVKYTYCVLGTQVSALLSVPSQLTEYQYYVRLVLSKHGSKRLNKEPI